MDNRLLARLAVAAILGVFVFYSFARPGWETQFKATLAALEKTHSYRVSIVSRDLQGGSFQLLQETNCQGDYHTLQQHYSADGTLDAMQDLESWSLGGVHVSRQHTSINPIEIGFAPSCDRRDLLEPIMVNYQMILAHGNGVRKGKKTVDGKKCRVWTIQMPAGDHWTDVYDMCIADDNLPLEITAGDARVIHASQWNQKIDLPKPPDISTESTQ
jgi:hypothetical protein